MIYLNAQRPHHLPMRSVFALVLLWVASLSGQQPNVAAPLPDPAELLRRLDANQKNVEQLRRNYICLVQQEVTDFDKEGKVKKAERREYDMWFVAGSPVQRLIRKDGAPLDAKEQKKEAERVTKQEKEARDRRAKRERGENDKDDLSVADFLRISRFVNLRREPHKGRELLAMDFVPNPAFKPHGRAENFASRLEGTIWIDEHDLQVARLEAHFIKGMRIGGFLASVKEGSQAVFEQARVNDEVWLPTLIDADLGARVLFKSVNQRLVNKYSNYRKFTTTSTIRGVVDEQPQQPK
jgi:hypothetical protein